MSVCEKGDTISRKEKKKNVDIFVKKEYQQKIFTRFSQDVWPFYKIMHERVKMANHPQYCHRESCFILFFVAQSFVSMGPVKG